MKYIIASVIVLLLFQACSHQPENQEDYNTDNINSSREQTKPVDKTSKIDTAEVAISKSRTARSYFVNSIKDSLNTEFISENLAVLFYPNDSIISKLQREWGESFMTVADDNSYYTYELGELFDSLKIKTIHSNKRHFVFKGNHKDYIMDLNGVQGQSDSIYWDVVLFNVVREPIFVDYVEPDIAKIKDYMRIE
ncbi:MAG: hypothetical protein RLO81_07965 [Fulvivirga sp.]|uniref:hypothetical protein n=1 Tax=Fulvivirga sp. TaxID=1931237 RepID=UPI0032EFEB35